MDISLQPGKYVVAVSGGVDSVVLLDLLTRQAGLKLVVAHFDHGIRKDSKADRLFVEKLAKKYKVPFVYDEGRLGPGASEAAAREARYKFLRKVCQAGKAGAIITAHHQDDVLETAIINLLRGTGRRGLTALASREGLVRPLLDTPKNDIIRYAEQHKLQWREDPTNAQANYLRNRVRHEVMTRLSTSQRQRLLNIITKTRQVNQELNTLLAEMLDERPAANVLERQWFTHFPHEISREIMAAWLRQNHLTGFDRPALERLTVEAKVARPGSLIDIKKGASVKVGRRKLALGGLER